MNRPTIGRLAATVLAVAAVALLAFGCGKNRAGTLLLPTGPRAVDHPGGALYGKIHYESAVYPDLGTAPFPPTVVSLIRDSVVVAVDSMAAGRDTFRFDGIPGAYYTLKIESRVFAKDSLAPALRVLESPRLVDDRYLAPNSSALNTVYLVLMGQMPGFGPDGFLTGDTSLLGLNLGVWTYPNDFAIPLEIPAGTYRFKFVTDPTDPRGTIGWGGDSTAVLTAPVANARVRFGVGPAADLKVHFPTTGVYTFDLDERREVFSVRLMSATARMAARRIR